MPRFAHYALHTLRWLVVAVCGVVLVVTLIMWPRSYFYYDGLIGPNYYTEQAAATIGYGFIIDFEGLSNAQSLRWYSSLRNKQYQGFGYHRVPFGWMEDGGRYVTFYVEWYCLPIFALVVSLIAAGRNPASWIRFVRFRVYDFFIATILVAWACTSAQF